jgi:hypothetical protein
MRPPHVLWAILLVAVGLSAHATIYMSPSTAFTTGGTTVYLEATETIGCSGTCDPPKVYFGGIESPHVEVRDSNHVSAVTPAYPAEAIVAVMIVRTGGPTAIQEGRFAFLIDRVQVLVPLSVDAFL